MYDIDIALSWEFRELITRESETILPSETSAAFKTTWMIIERTLYLFMIQEASH